MFLFSLMWSFSYWPPAPIAMTGEPNLETFQLGYANAATLQEKTGIPAIFFGILQFFVLLAIYLKIQRKKNEKE